MAQNVRALSIAPSVPDMGEEEDVAAEIDDMRNEVVDQKDMLREQVDVLRRQVNVLECQVRVLESTVAHMRDIWRVVGRLLDRHIDPPG